jgi:hypothetical protein
MELEELREPEPVTEAEDGKIHPSTPHRAGEDELSSGPGEMTPDSRMPAETERL